MSRDARPCPAHLRATVQALACIGTCVQRHHARHLNLQLSQASPCTVLRRGPPAYCCVTAVASATDSCDAALRGGTLTSSPSCICRHPATSSSPAPAPSSVRTSQSHASCTVYERCFVSERSTTGQVRHRANGQHCCLRCAAPTVVMSPAHCYYDTTTEVATLVPRYYLNATAQIGRHVTHPCRHDPGLMRCPVQVTSKPLPARMRCSAQRFVLADRNCIYLRCCVCRYSNPGLPADAVLTPDPYESIQAHLRSPTPMCSHLPVGFEKLPWANVSGGAA